MPPFVSQKRASQSPHPADKVERKAKRYKQSAQSPARQHTVQDNKAFLNALDQISSDETTSEGDNDDFEDVLPAQGPACEDDEDVTWENAVGVTEEGDDVPSRLAPTKDLQITLNDNNANASLSNPYNKAKGPTKIERQIRTNVHRMHVQCLLFHNLIRNGWATDMQTQEYLVEQLPSSVKKEIERWRSASGLPASDTGKKLQSSKGRKNRRGRPTHQGRNQRDWGRPAERQEPKTPDMSKGDPIVRLLKILATYWRKRFCLTYPCLRKQGYKALPLIEEELAAWKLTQRDTGASGECIADREGFRSQAKMYEGSRDVGAQLFTALVRGIGIDARLVASLQPLGFGWNKGEEATQGTPIKKKAQAANAMKDIPSSSRSTGRSTERDSSPSKSRIQKVRNKRNHVLGSKAAPVRLDENSSSDEQRSDHLDLNSDAESLVDITPAAVRQKPNIYHDRDMPAPTYWTEAISPITNEVYPVEAFMLNPAVAIDADSLAQFEPRGAKADKARQVFAYVVAYSSDGTAKDVTTRYLKRHLWPGRTKGVRMPPEKVPVYNRRGKIKRYEQHDWTKRAIGVYGKHHSMRTAVDDVEDVKDLKPLKAPTRESKGGEETLQGYKSSAEFVLKRHLRREEALRPDAKPVKQFSTGKGDNTNEEPVFLRKDVETCRTVESWHKEGRTVKEGQQAWKQVPVRAVTANRKREVEEVERESGQKAMQGLYAMNQTEWIIPDPIEDGMIPKNAYGNIDCFVPTMVPRGAVHIPLRNTAKVCRKLEIDYAEACTGFEFGHRMAVPVIAGVVVAAENEEAVIREWERDEEERKIKEEGKREKQALNMWRKWMLSLRVLQRVKDEYGENHLQQEENPFVNQKRRSGYSGDDISTDAASLMLKGESSVENKDTSKHCLAAEHDIGAGGFLVDENEDDHFDGELTVEVHHDVNEPKQDHSRMRNKKPQPSPLSVSFGASDHGNAEDKRSALREKSSVASNHARTQSKPKLGPNKRQRKISKPGIDQRALSVRRSTRFKD